MDVLRARRDESSAMKLGLRVKTVESDLQTVNILALNQQHKHPLRMPL